MVQASRRAHTFLICVAKSVGALPQPQSLQPAEIVEKMVEGRVRKFLAEISLVEQPFIKNPDMKIGALLKQAGATVVQFVRYQVGEGIEVEHVDFATEVASTMGQ